MKCKRRFIRRHIKFSFPAHVKFYKTTRIVIILLPARRSMFYKSCAEAVFYRSVKIHSPLQGTSRRKATLAPLARRSTFRKSCAEAAFYRNVKPHSPLQGTSSSTFRVLPLCKIVHGTLRTAFPTKLRKINFPYDLKYIGSIVKLKC